MPFRPSALPRRIASAVAIALLGGLLSAVPAAAEEPYLAFIEGLRERGYYDYALDYIRGVGDEAPTEVTVRLPYEEGLTLMASARTIKSFDRQKETLDEAAARFEQFTKAAPKDHPLQSEANMQRARILLNKGRVETRQAEDPKNQGNAEAFRKRAREYIRQAREVFQVAYDQYEQQYKQFPTYIPDDDPQFEQRRQIEQQYIASQYDLARTIYDEAQTFPEGSDQRKAKLDEAAAAFEAMHQRYRSLVSGLFARLWQGKTFEEQDEIRKALGIYNEILEHPAKSGAMENLQDTARRFRLICLNHPERQDHLLVIDEATAWRADARGRVRSEVGLGITYEMARAYEALGDDRNTSPELQTDSYKKARNFAEVIARSSDELKNPANAMLVRLQGKLGADAGEPDTFDAAYGQADLMLKDYQEQKANYDAAVSKGDTKAAAEAQATMQASAQNMTRLYRLAIQLARPELDPALLAVAYFRLTYSHLVAGENLPAAVLGKYVAQRYREDDRQVATEAGYVALAAFTQEFNQSPQGRRDFELRQAREIADQIVEDFPESARANDARMTVGQLYQANEQPIEAAAWFDQIPPTADNYPDAQMQSGLQYWNAFVLASGDDDGETSAERLQELRKSAESRLQTGIDRTENKLPSDAEAPQSLLFAKLVLSQIRNADGVYKTQGKKTGALDLLTGGPHAVVAAVEKVANDKRPKENSQVASRANASGVYQTLLRTQMGMKDVDAARGTMKKLEAVAGDEDAAALTQIYESLGKSLQSELKQLRQSGQDDRVADLQESFNDFLDELSGRDEGQTYNSLFWMAETYNALGNGAKEAGEADATGFFDKSATAYNRIIDRAAAEPDFLPSPDYLTGVKVRLANSQRLQGAFAAAEKTLLEVLAASPRSLDAQQDAALLFEEWGTAESDPAKLETALVGRKADGIWGWAITAAKLQNEARRQPDDETMRENLFDAKHKLGETSLALGRTLSDGERAREVWADGRRKIEQFAALMTDFPRPQYERFNELYGELLGELGEEVVDLPLDQSVQTMAVSAEATDEADAPAPVIPTPEEPPAAEGASVQWGPIALLLVGLVVAVGGYVAYEKHQAKRRREKLGLTGGGGSRSSRGRRGRSRGRGAKPAEKPADSGGGTATKAPPKKRAKPAASDESAEEPKRSGRSRRRPGRRR